VKRRLPRRSRSRGRRRAISYKCPIQRSGEQQRSETGHRDQHGRIDRGSAAVRESVDGDTDRDADDRPRSSPSAVPKSSDRSRIPDPPAASETASEGTGSRRVAVTARTPPVASASRSPAPQSRSAICEPSRARTRPARASQYGGSAVATIAATPIGTPAHPYPKPATTASSVVGHARSGLIAVSAISAAPNRPGRVVGEPRQRPENGVGETTHATAESAASATPASTYPATPVRRFTSGRAPSGNKRFVERSGYLSTFVAQRSTTVFRAPRRNPTVAPRSASAGSFARRLPRVGARKGRHVSPVAGDDDFVDALDRHGHGRVGVDHDRGASPPRRPSR